ncbi:MAG: glycosyltransferase family 39 protein [Sedimentisphaerales bacterium]
MTETLKKHQLLLICLTLTVATLIAYEPIRHNDFVEYDDYKYITENPNVQTGLTQESINWAFTSFHASNWHPLTWLSHMLDYQLYGLKPMGHHITNLLLHIANTLLLFWLLQKMTGSTPSTSSPDDGIREQASSLQAGAIWKSAFVAAAFALHPVHVESVAWAAERKDVLSTFFWMLTILAYVRYIEKPGIDRYILIILAFAMGLMSKPMVVTLPFVLLVLDYWPLERIGRQMTDDGGQQKKTIRRLIIEKIPLFAMSAASCVITFIAQKSGGTMPNLTAWPWYARVVNALGTYFNYMVKILYPTKLGVLYPFEGHLSIQAALVTILGAALILYYWGRGRRWLVAGLLWYLGTLVPVIGLVQVGAQRMADRYTYIPSIGIFIIISWGMEEIVSGTPAIRYKKIALASIAAAVTIAMIFLTRTQVGYWQDSGKLFKRTIDVTKNNCSMFVYYGNYLYSHGRHEEGMQFITEASRLCPDDLLIRHNMCTVLLEQNKTDEAIDYLTETLKKARNWPEAYKLYCMLGLAYERKGELSAAQTNYKKALELKSDYTPAQNGLASVLAKRRQRTEGR